MNPGRLLRLFRRRPHRHVGVWWDGFFEHCRCDATAGDRRDANGLRHIRFDDWPDTRPAAAGDRRRGVGARR